MEEDVRRVIQILFLSGSHVVSLGGRGGLLFRLSPGPRRTSGASVSLTFKTLRNSGVLLRAEGRSEHGLVLQLEEGKLLLLLLRKGTAVKPPDEASEPEGHSVSRSWTCSPPPPDLLLMQLLSI